MSSGYPGYPATYSLQPDCSLHLASQFSLSSYYVSPIYTQESTPGIIMASGMCVCMYVYICVCLCVHVCMCVCVVCMCVYVCMCEYAVCVYVCLHTYVRMYACLYVCSDLVYKLSIILFFKVDCLGKLIVQ